MNETANKLRELADMIDSGEISVWCTDQMEGNHFALSYKPTPKTHTVYNVYTGEASEVPKPLSVKLEKGDEYSLIDMKMGRLVVETFVWHDDKLDNGCLAAGNCFSTEADAIANRDAMFGKPE